MAIHSSILACRIPWAEEPAGRQSMGLQKVTAPAAARRAPPPPDLEESVGLRGRAWGWGCVTPLPGECPLSLLATLCGRGAHARALAWLGKMGEAVPRWAASRAVSPPPVSPKPAFCSWRVELWRSI